MKKHGLEAKRSRQFKGAPDAPDVVVEGLSEVFYIECKRRERLEPYPFMEQAIKDAGFLAPLVFMRSSKKDWLVLMKAVDVLALLKILEPCLK